MKINKILPAHTRTIFIQTYTDSLVNMNGQFYKYISKYKTTKPLKKIPDIVTFKFKLNIPQMVLYGNFYSIDNKLIQYFPLNENNEQCYSPFLNTGSTGNICLGNIAPGINDLAKNNDPILVEKIIEKIYNSPFSFDRKDSTWKYVNKNNRILYNLDSENAFVTYNVLEFYQNWQDTGKLELIKSNPDDQFISRN